MSPTKILLLSILFLFTSSCALIPEDIIGTITEETARPILKSQLKKIVSDKAPLLPSPNSPFSIISKLPETEFKPNLKTQLEIKYSATGETLLQAGDYIIPVMTFCLQHSVSSPSGHIYTLNQLQGKSAKMIRQINLKAFPKYKVSETQSLIWNILGGLSYSEMDSTSQKIIDAIIPEYKKDLQKSYYQQVEEKWDSVASKSQGIIPDFKNASNKYLNDLGEVGSAILEVKNLHEKIVKANGDYESLRSAISTRRLGQKETSTAWSKISDRVYARFLTDGSFNNVGTLQVRVLPLKRNLNSTEQDFAAIDIYSLVADANTDSVQSMLLSPLYGFSGVAVRSASANPFVAAAVMAALLAGQNIDWDSFFDLAKQAKTTNQSVKEMVKHGENLLSEVHDRLDKLLKDDKVVSDKGLVKNGDTKTRQYIKKGDKTTQKEDFDKLPGEKSISQDGTEMKTLPNGDKIVKRQIKKSENPTLEVQPPSGEERIKVRYEP
jgi:hypothetical protein